MPVRFNTETGKVEIKVLPTDQIVYTLEPCDAFILVHDLVLALFHSFIPIDISTDGGDNEISQ